mmetsp:Transcript_7994/g.18871  ORF Transcript_7994/g.18871 Transcript_7994/m.18871 type:complete len:230 (-) Transcript_7994:8-697(-)
MRPEFNGGAAHCRAGGCAGAGRAGSRGGWSDYADARCAPFPQAKPYCAAMLKLSWVLAAARPRDSPKIGGCEHDRAGCPPGFGPSTDVPARSRCHSQTQTPERSGRGGRCVWFRNRLCGYNTRTTEPPCPTHFKLSDSGEKRTDLRAPGQAEIRLGAAPPPTGPPPRAAGARNGGPGGGWRKLHSPSPLHLRPVRARRTHPIASVQRTAPRAMPRPQCSRGAGGLLTDQ